VADPFEHDNELSGSVKAGNFSVSSQEGLCFMELINWIHLVQEREQWRALLNTVMNPQVQ